MLLSLQVNDVLNGMIKRNILAVPVLMKTGGKYYGESEAAKRDANSSWLIMSESLTRPTIIVLCFVLCTAASVRLHRAHGYREIW